MTGTSQQHDYLQKGEALVAAATSQQPEPTLRQRAVESCRGWLCRDKDDCVRVV